MSRQYVLLADITLPQRPFGMSQDFDFSQDTEFKKLIDWRPDIDLTVAALELARDAYPMIDFAVTQNWIVARADELRMVAARTSDEHEAIEIVAKHIAVEHGIIGSEAAYKSPDASFLNRIIEKKLGIPISLTLLHVAVCRELGIDLQPVGSPRHFLSRIDTPAGPLFLDAFAGARIMTETETLDWLSELTHLSRREIARNLEPATPRTIISRMLNNLKVIYAEEENWESTWKVQSRLMALNPSSYPERRDLAIVAVKAQRSGAAIRLIKSLLKGCPEEDREGLEELLEQSQRELPMWN